MNIKDKVNNLSFWSGAIEIAPVSGGITNQNFIVTDGADRYFVRVGEDIPLHGIMRFNELAASHAAHSAGLSPAVVHSENGIMILEHIDGKPLSADDFQDPDMLFAAVDLLKEGHDHIASHLRGPVLVFWVFHVIRDYLHTLTELNHRSKQTFPELISAAQNLEQQVGQVSMVFAHNDLLPANFMHDGERLWLIDWDYAGFNSPLFDIGGLCSNNHLNDAQEQQVLARYFSSTPGESLQRQYSAFKCASLLRETLWSMVSEQTSLLDFDYVSYSDTNMVAFQTALDRHVSLFDDSK